MKKSGITIVLITSVIILLLIVQTILSNRLSTSGALVSKVDKEIKAYKTENAVIREKLFLQSSLNNIASKAAELGFTGGKFVALTKSLPLAARQ